MPLIRTPSLSNLANLLSPRKSSPRKSSPRKSSPRKPPCHPGNITGKRSHGIAHKGGKTRRRK